MADSSFNNNSSIDTQEQQGVFSRITTGARDAIGVIKESAQGAVGAVKERVGRGEYQANDSKAESDRRTIGAEFLEHGPSTLRHIEAPDDGVKPPVKDAWMSDQAARVMGTLEESQPLTTKIAATAQNTLGIVQQKAQDAVGAIKEKVWGSDQGDGKGAMATIKEKAQSAMASAQDAVGAVKEKVWGGDQHTREGQGGDAMGAIREKAQDVKERAQVVAQDVKEKAQDAVGAVKEKIWGSDEQARDSIATSEQGPTLKHVDTPHTGPSDAVKDAFLADQADRKAGKDPAERSKDFGEADFSSRQDDQLGSGLTTRPDEHLESGFSSRQDDQLGSDFSSRQDDRLGSDFSSRQDDFKLSQDDQLKAQDPPDLERRDAELGVQEAPLERQDAQLNLQEDQLDRRDDQLDRQDQIDL